MNFQKSTVLVFDKLYEKLASFHAMLKTRQAVIAYSGGKDSTLLVRFYQYLYLKNKSSEPILFHLDHSIRNNENQENEIYKEMQSISNQTFVKKKIFLKFQNT